VTDAPVRDERDARRHGTRRRRLRSIKWRLVALFVLLAMATSSVFLFGMQRVLQSGWQGYAKPMVGDYVDKLAAEIGSPPDVARAQALVARLPLSVRIEGPQVRFDSHPERYRFWHSHNRREYEMGTEGWGLMRTTADGHRISFGLARPMPIERPQRIGLITLAALLTLTLLAYFYIRKLLKPLDAIGAGVARFGAGDFGEPIVATRRDELGDLAGRINEMARSLQGMLDAKRALLLAISHELRSPLTRARVNAELVPEGEHRDALLRDLSEMRDLITGLLESERLAIGHAALQTERVDLAALARELVATQFADAGLTLQLDDTLGPVSADPMRVRLLLRNLIDNALRHSAGAPQPPVVSLSREAGSLRVSVRDFGPGVSDEQLAHLAEPFYRADSARQRATGGFGLGLYLCRLIAQAHGGTLTFRHAEPGLEVTASWPIAEAEPLHAD
jgi:signal transduction histidine kinase